MERPLRSPLVVVALSVALTACSPTAAHGPAPDAGLAVPDAGLAVPDAGLAVPDAGLAVPDAGPAVPDAGLAVPDPRPPTPVAPPTTTVTLDRSSAAAAARMLADVAALVDLGPRPSGSDAERAAARHLAAALAAAATTVFIEEVPLPTGASSRNLWATFGDGERSILLGAHYDSIRVSPGANDNAGGVAVLLELARRLAERPVAARVTIVFFGAEEIIPGYTRDEHHFGSRLRAAALAESGDLPGLMISVDMIGVGERLLAVTFRDSDPAAARLVELSARTLGLDVAIERRGDISDHEAFARAGVPSVFLWRPDDPDYHSARDTGVEVERIVEALLVVEHAIATAAAE